MPQSGKVRIHFRWLAVLAATMVTVPNPAYACMMWKPPTPADVQYADVVVIGRIANYHIVRDEAFRKRKLKSPNLTPKERQRYSDPKRGLITDHSKFAVQVEKTLVGPASKTLSVTWRNSTFGQPDKLDPGPYLIAMRRHGSANPPLRGPSATVFPDPDPKALQLLQAPCSSAFVFKVGSSEAQQVMKILRARKK